MISEHSGMQNEQYYETINVFYMNESMSMLDLINGALK